MFETLAAFSAFGIVLAGLLRFSLYRTRLLLFLPLSFFAAGIIDTLHALDMAGFIGFGLDTYGGSMPDIWWVIGCASLAILLLLGLLLDRIAPVVKRPWIEGIAALVAVLVAATVTVFVLSMISLPVSRLAIPGISQPGQLLAGLLYVAVLPAYFRIYQRQQSHLPRAIVIFIIYIIFGQLWMAGSSRHSGLTSLAAHASKVGAYVTVLLSFQLLGAESEREAIAAARQRGLILEVAQAASEGGGEISRMVERVAEEMATVLGVVRVAILLPEPDGKAMCVMGGYDTRHDFSSRVGALLPLEGVPALSRAMGACVVTHLEVNERHVLDAELLDVLQRAGIGSVTIVPLLVRGRCVGVVGISSPDKAWHLSPEDEALALAIASQIAAMLENARLLTATEQQAEVEATLYQAVAALNADLEPNQVLAEIANQLRSALNAEVCSISEWDIRRNAAISRVEDRSSEGEQKAGSDYDYNLSGYPLARRALESQETVVVYTDDPQQENAAECALLEALGQQSLLLLPLMDKGDTIGLAEVYHSRPRRFQTNEIELAQVLAQQAGAALQRSRLYNLERDRSAQLSVLNWLANVVTGPIPEEATLDESARRLSLALRGARAVLIYARRPDERTLQLSASTGLPDHLAGRRTVRRILCSRVEAVLSPENPVAIPVNWQESIPSDLAQAIALLELDPLGGVAVYVEGELALLVVLAFKPEALPGEREWDFLLTLAASLSQSLTSRLLFERIAAERERLRTILTSTSEAVLLTSQQAEIVLLNPAAEQLFGVSIDEVVGRPLDVVLSHSALEDIIRRMRANEIEVLERIDIALSDGRALQTSVAPVRAANGEIQGYVIDMADVTALQTLSEQKSQVLRMASHDLMNPLGQVIGGFELLVEDLPPLDPLAQEIVENIKMGLERMNKLIKGLLDLERLEAGILGKRQVTTTDLLVREAVTEMELSASERQHSIQLNLAPDLPAVSVDVTQMHRAICNLVENAIKYTPPGGAIEISTQLAGEEVEIAVADNGPGVPEEDQPKLFQRFYRAYQPGTEGVPGTGLGLNLVKSVVELHGGTVSVESAPSEGSTFTIRLPTAEAESVG
jgi:PAS domain S-box-containing protein